MSVATCARMNVDATSIFHLVRCSHSACGVQTCEAPPHHLLEGVAGNGLDSHLALHREGSLVARIRHEAWHEERGCADWRTVNNGDPLVGSQRALI